MKFISCDNGQSIWNMVNILPLGNPAAFPHNPILRFLTARSFEPGYHQMLSGADLVGLFAAILVVFCYARVQWQRDYVRRVRYSLLNLFAGILMLVPVWHYWNGIALAFDCAWLAISYYGLHRNIKYIRLQREQKRFLAGRRAARR